MKLSTTLGWMVTTMAIALSGCAGQHGGHAAMGATDHRTPVAPSIDRTASTTIFPTSLAGRPMAQVGQVVGLMLEQRGMTNLELAVTAFTPPDGADLDATAVAFGAFVAAQAITTDYALYCEFRVSPSKANGGPRSFTEVRTIVAARSGAIAWKDSQTAADADFARVRPAEPMQCCMLVADRLRPVFGLTDPAPEGGPEGKLARQWRTSIGIPDKGEEAAIEQRTTGFRSAASTATVVVFAPHAAPDFTTSAADLVGRINKAGLVKAIAAADRPDVTVVADMNEQKTLWSLARGFSAYLTKHPPQGDYALLADYLTGTRPGGEFAVGGVHVVVCDKAGQIVLVDFQNSHHEDFRSIHPASREECDALVVRRLGTYCK